MYKFPITIAVSGFELVFICSTYITLFVIALVISCIMTARDKKMEFQVVCQNHIVRPEGIEMYPIQYPCVREHEAEKMGWRLTSHRLFSQDEQVVWICPDCVKWLQDYQERGPIWQSDRGVFYPWQDDQPGLSTSAFT